MKASTVIAPLLLVATALAQSRNCDGDLFIHNDVPYCCVNGQFSGPLISSFSSRLTTFPTQTGNSGINNDATPTVILARAITTQVTSGLTCIGDSANTSGESGLTATTSSSDTSTTSISGTTTTSSASVGAASSSSSSKAGVPMVTPGPVLMGAAAVAFAAYGAM